MPYCIKCGKQIPDGEKLCTQHAPPPEPSNQPEVLLNSAMIVEKKPLKERLMALWTKFREKFSGWRLWALLGGVLAAILAVIAVILFATHVFCFHDWAEATCVEPEICTICDRERGEANGHDWGDATCLDPQLCTVCGEEMGESLGHDWTAANCLEPKTCARCDYSSGEALGHDWIAANCQSPKTCSRCDITEGEKGDHDWNAATCTKPKTCSICGKTSGKSKGHNWSAATCTVAKKCKTCGASSGGAAGHNWKAADCQNPKTCKSCGTTTGTIGDHKWENATIVSPKTCSVCGRTSGARLNYYSIGTGWVDVDSDSTLLLRDSMSDSAKNLASIPDNAKISLWDCNSSGWYYSTYEGKYGYVKSAYVTFSDPTKVTTKPTPTYTSKYDFVDTLNEYYEDQNPSNNSGNDSNVYMAEICNNGKTCITIAVVYDFAKVYNNRYSIPDTYAELEDSIIEFSEIAGDFADTLNTEPGLDFELYIFDMADLADRGVADTMEYILWDSDPFARAKESGLYIRIKNGEIVYEK